jgi:hypothetical protein
VMDCRTARYGSMALGCDDCEQQSIQYHACGNRACHSPDGRPGAPSKGVLQPDHGLCSQYVKDLCR